MNKCEEKAAGYVHPLWQEIYIGHICWGNPLRSLIEGGLWIQGSHDIDTQERTVTWLGSKSAALFPWCSWSPFDWECRRLFEIGVTQVHADGRFFYLSVSEGLSGWTKMCHPHLRFPPYTPLIPMGFAIFQEVFDDKANLNADSSLPLTGVSFSYQFPAFPRMLFDNPGKCAIVCIQPLTIYVSRKKIIRKRTVQQTHPDPTPNNGSQRIQTTGSS